MSLRLLKALVAIMGVLLVAGVAALAVLIAARLSHRPSPIPGGPPPGAAFTAPPIALPHGASIERMSTGPERIVLEILLADGSAELFEIDLASGHLIGIIPLKEAP